jgi:putative salt-induced outer membrane protein YdiY
MTLSQTATLLTALTACCAVSAATIELANGYKLEGKIIGRDEAAIHLLSPVMGRIDVPVSNVKSVVEDAPAAAVAAVPPVPPPPPPPPPPPLKSRADAFLERIYFLNHWKTDIALGLGFVSGERDSQNTSFAFSTERKWTSQELRFELLQQYEQATNSDGDDEVSKDMLKAIGRYRHDISERFFFQSETQYGYDNIKEIDQDIRESVGLGWRVIKTERSSLSLTPAMTVQRQVIDGESQGVTYAPTLFEEFTFDWSRALSFRQECSALFPVNGDSDPSYHFSLALKNRLSEHLSLNILYLYDYDGSVADDIEPGQQSLNLMLGVSF